MFSSIKFRITLGAAILIMLIMTAIPIISQKVEDATVLSFEKQATNEQINLLSAIIENQREGLISWMGPWYSDSNLAPLLPKKPDIKSWEANLLGIGNQISARYQANRISTFSEELKLLADYSPNANEPAVNFENEDFKTILAESEDEDATAYGHVKNEDGQTLLVVILPVEHRASETAFYQAIFVNVSTILKTYRKSTKYSSYFSQAERKYFDKTDADAREILKNVTAEKYIKFKEKLLFKRIIPLPETMLGKNSLLNVFIDVTTLKKEFDTTKKNVLIILGTIFLISMPALFGLVFMLLKPLGKILRISSLVSEGNYSARSDLKSKSEIGVLSDSFNQMLNQIENKDENMTSLLDGLTVGVFHFDKSGVIPAERSKMTRTLFEGMDSVETIDQFLEKYCGKDPKESNEVAMEMMFDPNGMLDFDSLVSGFFPTQINLDYDNENHKCIRLIYRPINNADGALNKVIVITEDITRQIRAELTTAYQKERVQRISLASSNTESYLEQIEVVKELYKICDNYIKENTNPDITKFLRDLHSLKGTLAMSNFEECAKNIHDMETQITEYSFEKSIDKLKENLEQSFDRFLIYFKDLVEVLGLENDAEYIKVAKGKIEALEKAVSENSPMFEIEESLKTFNMYPIAVVLSKYNKYVETICERLGKEAKLVFDSKSCEVTIHEMSELDASFGHVLRNSLDHGIEDPEIRVEKGKDQVGTLTILITRKDDQSLQIEISDDGAGINTEVLMNKAVENKHWSKAKSLSATEDEKIDLIFCSGLSSKEAVSDTSGRGVGMDAVKSYFESIGGSVVVKSAIEKGSTFTFNTRC